MRTADKSLHLLVDKWLDPSPASPVHVMRFGHMPANRLRYALVQAWRPAGTLSMFFFRHDDGAWCVFPPAAARPAMSVAAPGLLAGCDR